VQRLIQAFQVADSDSYRGVRLRGCQSTLVVTTLYLGPHSSSLRAGFRSPWRNDPTLSCIHILSYHRHIKKKHLGSSLSDYAPHPIPSSQRFLLCFALHQGVARCAREENVHSLGWFRYHYHQDVRRDDWWYKAFSSRKQN